MMLSMVVHGDDYLKGELGIIVTIMDDEAR